jgi:hypothetical protein
MALATEYLNVRGTPPRVCRRWWAHPSVLVGGNVLSAEDWASLRDGLGVRSVLNVDHLSSEGLGIERLCQAPVPDDGTPLPAGLVRHAVSFARLWIGLGPVYVHCHLGVSRSPAFAYAVMRWALDMGPDAALEAVRSGGGELGRSYGEHPRQRAYLDSVEAALRG